MQRGLVGGRRALQKGDNTTFGTFGVGVRDGCASAARHPTELPLVVTRDYPWASSPTNLAATRPNIFHACCASYTPAMLGLTA